MGIRVANLGDVKEIKNLLAQLDYDRPLDFLTDKLKQMLNDKTYHIWVYEMGGKAVALMTIHYYRQIAYKGEVANISFFVVDESVRSKGIGKKMEEYFTNVAIERNCALIELYSSNKRVEAHRFYERQGYEAYEKFFMKELHEKI